MTDRTSGQPTTMFDLHVILTMLAVVVIPVAATHLSIRDPSTVTSVANPSPYGYTVSLLLFLVPVLAISRWHLSGGIGFDEKAYLWSVGIMAGIGAVLDIAFGYHFFVFPNEGATLGIRVPAFDWSSLSFVPSYLPIEEFGFYILGGIFMASVYLWAEQYWLSAYSRPDYHEAAKAHPRLIHLSVPVLVVWAALLVAGIVFRALTQGGLPGYFLFIMIGGAAPTILLIRGVKDFVNWHAMAFAFFSLLLLSVIWEASLAIPYDWWNYRTDEMLGIFIPGWSELPLEAVMVWVLGVWDAVLLYEFLRIFLRMELEPRHRFRGVKEATTR